jgi:hypothetical protein
MRTARGLIGSFCRGTAGRMLARRVAGLCESGGMLLRVRVKTRRGKRRPREAATLLLAACCRRRQAARPGSSLQACDPFSAIGEARSKLLPQRDSFLRPMDFPKSSLLNIMNGEAMARRVRGGSVSAARRRRSSARRRSCIEASFGWGLFRWNQGVLLSMSAANVARLKTGIGFSTSMGRKTAAFRQWS